MHCASKDKWFKTRIGTIVGAYVLDCLSGQRDIGGSVVTRSARIVLSVGASDCWQEIYFRIAVSDDGGKSFAVKFERPAIEDVTYHTTGMIYDEKNDVLMAITRHANCVKRRMTRCVVVRHDASWGCLLLAVAGSLGPVRGSS